MKQFNLEEYCNNPSRKVVTRNGMNARIICTDRNDSLAPVVALIDMKLGEMIIGCTRDGNHALGFTTDYDLFFVPEKHEGWINVYSYPDNNIYAGTRVYNSREVAEEIGKDQPGYLTTSKIEWEE